MKTYDEMITEIATRLNGLEKASSTINSTDRMLQEQHIIGMAYATYMIYGECSVSDVMTLASMRAEELK